LLFGLPTVSSDRTAMPEVAGGLASLFDPTAAGAQEVLAARIRGHFMDQPIPAPTEEQRRTHATAFSWDLAASALLATFDEVAASA